VIKEFIQGNKLWRALHPLKGICFVADFENPKSTTIDKILSFIDSSLAYNIFAAFGPSPGDRIEAKVDKQLKAIDNIGVF
jgi:hypothetical protein